MVVPVNPLQGGDFDGFAAPPGLPVNQFRFVQAIDGFRQGVVVAVSFATNRGLFQPQRDAPYNE